MLPPFLARSNGRGWVGETSEYQRPTDGLNGTPIVLGPMPNTP